MRRVGGLWPELVSLGNLFASAHAAARGKRGRPDVARFLLHLEPAVLGLRRELLDGTYRPGPYRVFTVNDPKQRRISAAAFRDRVVHHALTRVLEPVFEPRFTADSYACRRGFGTHAALRRAHRAAGPWSRVLKCDVVKFFPSVDHQILLSLVERKVKCRPTLALARTIVAASNPQIPHAPYFPGDDLFTPHLRRRGLPIGNQTSQFFANVYLDPLDHFVREQLRPADYVRYCDDFLLFGDSRAGLEEMLAEVDRFLVRLRLLTHPRKSRVYRCRDGVTFLGWRVFPDRLRLVRSNVVRFKRRGRAMQRAYARGEMTWDEIGPRLRGWIAHASHGDTWRLRTQVLDDLAFRKGCNV
jgi:RNA-directed DNA polymerase